MTDAKRNKYSISSVKKALKVLKLFDENNKDMTLTEISEKFGMFKGTMIRMLSTLEEEGFVRYDERSRRYQLGVVIRMLASTAFNFVDLVSVARPYLLESTKKLNLIAHLASLEGDKILLVDRVLPNGNDIAYDLSSTIGGLIEPHCTGVGKILFAFADEGIKNSMLSNCNFAKYSERTITDKNVFIKESQNVRELGYAVNNGENETYLKCITYPVFDYRNEIRAAISMTGLIQVFNKDLDELCHKELKYITVEISKKLGQGLR